jgi:hypothetical protein
MKTRAGLRKEIYDEFKGILDSTNELVRVAQGMMAEMNQRGVLRPDSTSHEKASAVLFSEAYSRFLAVKLLCEDAMGNMSCIVLRSLLNLFIMFHWISKKRKEARAKRYVGWYWKMWKDKIALAPSSYDPGRRREVEKNYNAIRHLYFYRVKDKATGKFKRKLAKSWYEPWTIERMAKDVGLEGHYEDGYRILSRIEHVDPTHVLLKSQTGKITLDPCFDRAVLNESLVMNFSYFRSICATIDKAFSLGKEEVLRNLAQRQKSFKRP